MDVTPPQLTVKVPALNLNAHPKSPVNTPQLSVPIVKLTKPAKSSVPAPSEGGLPVFQPPPQQHQYASNPSLPIGIQQQPIGSSWVDSILDDAIQQINQHFMPFLYLEFDKCPENALRFFSTITQAMSFTQLAALWTWYAVGLPPPVRSILDKFGSFARLLTTCHALLNTPTHNQSQYRGYLTDIERYINTIDFLVLQRLSVKVSVAYSRNVLQQQVHQQAHSSFTAASSSSAPSNLTVPLDANGIQFNVNPYINQQ